VFARQATVVIERALLHEQLIRQSRLDREIEIAREILQGLTPQVAPAFPGVQVAGRSLTAETVGGDAFDFIAYPDAQLGVSISDAKGKGLPAALLALAHRAMLHALVSVELRLRATFGRISDLLARSHRATSLPTSSSMSRASKRRCVPSGREAQPTSATACSRKCDEGRAGRCRMTQRWWC